MRLCDSRFRNADACAIQHGTPGMPALPYYYRRNAPAMGAENITASASAAPFIPLYDARRRAASTAIASMGLGVSGWKDLRGQLAIAVAAPNIIGIVIIE